MHSLIKEEKTYYLLKNIPNFIKHKNKLKKI